MPAPPHFPAPGGPRPEEGPYRVAGEVAPESSGVTRPPAIHASDVEWQPPDPALARMLVAKASAEGPRPSIASKPIVLLAFCGVAFVLHSLFGRGARLVIGAVTSAR